MRIVRKLLVLAALVSVLTVAAPRVQATDCAFGTPSGFCDCNEFQSECEILGGYFWVAQCYFVPHYALCFGVCGGACGGGPECDRACDYTW
jgi:hypothetical protein